jgi:hypothetical protein
MALLNTAKSLLLPGYRLAQQKREFEKYLRSQGWSKKEALAAVARKFPKEGDKN